MVPSRLGPEAAEHDALNQASFGERRENGAKRDACGAVRRKAVSASRDRGIGNRGEAMLACEREAGAVARGEQPILAPLAAAPDRADGVNHVTRREMEARRDFGISRLAAAERGAGRAKLRAGGAVDRSVHSATAEQRPDGAADARIAVEHSEVASDHVAL